MSNFLQHFLNIQQTIVLKNKNKSISEMIAEEEKKNKIKDYDKRRETKHTQS